MIIQVKSSYSGASSHTLEENQELFICHAPDTLASEKHAYIQKTANEHAVARMYLAQGSAHLTPIEPMEGVLWQNRPFTADVTIGHGNLLQILESLLVFEVYGQTVTIMMGLVPGYKSTAPKKVIKVTGGTTPTPSLPITPISVSPLKPKTAQQPSDTPHAVADMKKASVASVSQKQAADEELSETDVLLSESTTTTMKFSGGKPVSDKDVTFRVSKTMLVAIAVCVVVVLGGMIWFIIGGKTDKSVLPAEHVVNNNKQAESESDGRLAENSKQMGAEEDKAPSLPWGKTTVVDAENTVGESREAAERKSGVITDGGAVSTAKQDPVTERTNTMATVMEKKTTATLPGNVKQPESGVKESNLLKVTEPIDDELTVAEKQYAKESKAFEEKLNNRLDNNQVYVQLWKVFREMRPIEENWKTADDYRRGIKYYEALDSDLVLAVKITALKQENEKAEKDQLLEQLRTKIETQKGIMLESARKAKMEPDLDIAGIDKEYVSLSKTIDGAMTEVTQLDAETSRIVKEGRKGRHLDLIQADTRALKDDWGKRKAILQDLEKDVTDIRGFEKLLKNGLEIRRQSEALTALYNTLNTGEKVEFQKIDDAYQLLGKSYEEIKAIDGLPPDVWKILAERRDVEEKFYKEAKEVLNVK